MHYKKRMELDTNNLLLAVLTGVGLFMGFMILSGTAGVRFEADNILHPLPRFPYRFDNEIESLRRPRTVVYDRPSHVKVFDQSDDCGSCWAMSFCTMLQYRGQKKCQFKTLFKLINGMGCNGGLLRSAGHALKTHSMIKTAYQIPPEAFKQELDERGPFAIHIITDPGEVMVMNKEGELNHAVLVVGYEDRSPADGLYLLIQNSWGEEWGDRGFQWVKFLDDAFVEAVGAFPRPEFVTEKKIKYTCDNFSANKS